MKLSEPETVAAQHDWAPHTVRRRARALGLSSSRGPGAPLLIEDAEVLAAVRAGRSLSDLARRLHVTRYAVALRASALRLPTRRDEIAAYARHARRVA